MPEIHMELVPQFYEMKVREVMDSRVWDLPILTEDEPLDHVLYILSGKDHLWVVKDRESQLLVGVVTEKDFLQIISPPRIQRYTLGRVDIKSLSLGTVSSVKSIMAHRLVTSTAEMSVKDAIMKMVKYKVRRLPVVADGKLIGELTLHDIINKYSQILTKRATGT